MSKEPSTPGDNSIIRKAEASGEIPAKWLWGVRVIKEFGYPAVMAAFLLWGVKTSVDKLTDEVRGLRADVQRLESKIERNR